MPVNIGKKDPPKDTKAAGTQHAQASKGDPGSRMFGDALRRLATKKGSAKTASSANVARQGLAKVDRVTGRRTLRRTT